MTYLLDTHILLWLAGSPERLDRGVLDAITDPSTTAAVSAVSALEIATKTRLGKFPDVGLVANWDAEIDELGMSTWPISSRHAILAGSMQWSHQDPFDRLLVAQAILGNATLVTVDRAICALEAPRILTW